MARQMSLIDSRIEAYAVSGRYDAQLQNLQEVYHMRASHLQKAALQAIEDGKAFANKKEKLTCGKNAGAAGASAPMVSSGPADKIESHGASSSSRASEAQAVDKDKSQDKDKPIVT